MRESPLPKVLNRREFLRGGIRYFLLAGVTAAAVRAVFKGGALPAGQSCVNAGYCRPCPNVDGCGLPQALSFRSVSQEKEGQRA